MTTLLTYALALWFAAGAAQDTRLDDSRVIASTGQWSITAGEFEAILESLPDQARAFFSVPENRRSFLDQLIEMWVLAEEGRREGVPGDANVKALLDFYSNNLIAGEYSRYITETHVVSESAIEQYYLSHEDEYTEVFLSHILILNADSPQVQSQNIPGALPQAEARRKIEEVRANLVPGASFEDLAREYSQDPSSAQTGGQIGYIARGQLVTEVEEAAFQLLPGITSDIVESPLGYHILRVTDRKTAPLDEVQDQIRQKLHDDHVKDQIQSRIEAAGVEVDETFFR